MKESDGEELCVASEVGVGGENITAVLVGSSADHHVDFARGDACGAAVFVERAELFCRHGVENGQVAVLRRDRVIHDRKRQVGPADFAPRRFQT